MTRRQEHSILILGVVTIMFFNNLIRPSFSLVRLKNTIYSRHLLPKLSTTTTRLQLSGNDIETGRRRTSSSTAIFAITTTTTSSPPPIDAILFTNSYKSHPAISNVALAQSLWASIIRPDVDTVIDATCGNGYDSIVIAKLLFQNHIIATVDEDHPPNNNNETKHDHPLSSTSTAIISSQLLCLDVQEEACTNTRTSLQSILPPYIMDHHVNVIQTSHERLPRPTSTLSVGLVVYNLGWLPNNNDVNGNHHLKKWKDDDDGATSPPSPTTKAMSSSPLPSSSSSSLNSKSCITTTETTIKSMTDAILLLRVGGMLSAVTYPRTNPQEADAVLLLVTCLGLLSSKTQTWEEEIENFIILGRRKDIDDDDNIVISTSSSSEDNDNDNETTATTTTTTTTTMIIAQHVKRAMERIVLGGPSINQTWRVSKHEKLGMDRAPILLTATRIK
jgi:hypothetical protein